MRLDARVDAGVVHPGAAPPPTHRPDQKGHCARRPVRIRHILAEKERTPAVTWPKRIYIAKRPWQLR